MSPQNFWPLDSSEHLEQALREQGETPDEIAELAPALFALRAWNAPAPTGTDKQRLLARLTPLLAELSLVRQVLRAQRRDAWGRLLTFLEVARAQVSILQPSFWLLSAFLVLLGFLAHFVIPGSYALILQIVGPFLAYLGTQAIFRCVRLHMLEFELSCPPSPQQLTIARLLVVLLYDIGLGLLLSLLLLTRGGESFLALTLDWLMPLLLIMGLTLLLSLRFSIYLAAAIAYIGWLMLLVLTLPIYGGAMSFSLMSLLAMGLVGLLFLAIAVRSIPVAIARQITIQ
jgi:hypothetical protein